MEKPPPAPTQSRVDQLAVSPTHAWEAATPRKTAKACILPTGYWSVPCSPKNKIRKCEEKAESGGSHWKTPAFKSLHFIMQSLKWSPGVRQRPSHPTHHQTQWNPEKKGQKLLHKMPILLTPVHNWIQWFRKNWNSWNRNSDNNENCNCFTVLPRYSFFFFLNHKN